MKLGLYLSFLLCAWQSYQVVVGFNIPLSRSSLDGLSRDALIELILGKSNSENKSSESVAIASAEKHHVSHISTPPPPKSPLLPLGDNMTSALPPLSSVVTNEKFYIYPLDKKFWWRWPRQNSSCTAHNQVGHNHAMNSGKIQYIWRSCEGLHYLCFIRSIDIFRCKCVFTKLYLLRTHELFECIYNNRPRKPVRC